MATKPDWEAIERAYRAGSLSIRNIAEKHGTKEGTIRSRAKKHGWQRDLTEQVKSSTNDKLSRSASRTIVTREDARSDAEIIEEASTEAASVVLSHRAELAEWRMIAQKLCGTLAGMEINASNHDKFARSLNAGVDAQLKVIKGERQAYNLDTEDGDKDVSSLSDLMDELSSEA